MDGYEYRRVGGSGSERMRRRHIYSVCSATVQWPDWVLHMHIDLYIGVYDGIAQEASGYGTGPDEGNKAKNETTTYEQLWLTFEAPGVFVGEQTREG